MPTDTERFPHISELVDRAREGQRIRYLVDSHRDTPEHLDAIEATIAVQPGPGEKVCRLNGSAGYTHPSGGSIHFSSSRSRYALRCFAGDVLVVDAPHLNIDLLIDISIIRHAGAEVFER